MRQEKGIQMSSVPQTGIPNEVCVASKGETGTTMYMVQTSDILTSQEK